jgi:hypothetical protein
MRVFALAAMISIALSGAGCLQASFTDGTLLCSGQIGRECPEGYYCAPDNYCFKNGHDAGLDLAEPQFDLSYTPPDDLSSVADDGDMSVALPTPDLLPLPPDLVSSHD